MLQRILVASASILPAAEELQVRNASGGRWLRFLVAEYICRIAMRKLTLTRWKLWLPGRAAPKMRQSPLPRQGLPS